MTSAPGSFVIDATDDTEFARSWAAMTGTADLSLQPAGPRSARDVSMRDAS